MNGKRSDDLYKKVGIIGDNGTGKTTYLLEEIKKIYDFTKNRVLILSDTDPKAYKGITRLKTYDELKDFESGIAKFFDYGAHPEEMLAKIISIFREGQETGEKYLQNGAIIFEDCSNYIMSNPPMEIRTFLGNYRMYHLDLFFISHTLTDFPSFLRRRMTYFTLFKTSEALGLKDLKTFRYPNAENVFEAWVKVMNDSNRFAHLTVKTGL